jgi:hypothetical protein
VSARQHVEGLVAGIPKDYRPIVRKALAQGWTLQQVGKGHPKLTSPDGTWSTPLPGSSSSPSLFKAVVSLLRKHGLDVAA